MLLTNTIETSTGSINLVFEDPRYKTLVIRDGMYVKGYAIEEEGLRRVCICHATNRQECICGARDEEDDY